MIEKARKFARKAHKGQFDKEGREYFTHVETVAAHCTHEKAKIVAYLHDTLEYTNTTKEDLIREFTQEIADLVDTLTHKETETYMEYIERVSGNPITIEVKLADLRHNMDLTRKQEITEKDIEHLKEKYVPAYNLLSKRSRKDSIT